MSQVKRKEEYIESLWNMVENGQHARSVLKSAMGEEFFLETLEELRDDGLIKLDTDGTEIGLTGDGMAYARKLIRAHRIGERLIHDVLGGDFEVGACEMEHIMNTGLVDSICTLLGHPRECPHGKPIPEGGCCRRAEKVAYSSVISLTEMEIGSSARVAYVCSTQDQQLHIIDSLQIKPGALVTLHQKYPSYVIKCEGSHIALDEEVASNIRLWKESTNSAPPPDTAEAGRRKHRHGKGFWNRLRK